MVSPAFKGGALAGIFVGVFLGTVLAQPTQVEVESEPEIKTVEVIKEVEVPVEVPVEVMQPYPESCARAADKIKELTKIANRYNNKSKEYYDYARAHDYRAFDNPVDAMHDTVIGLYSRLEKMSTELQRLFVDGDSLETLASLCKEDLKE